MKKILFLLILINASNLFAQTELDGMSFDYQIIEDSIQVTLSGETEGWISVGFNPTKKMQDADIIIGYIDDKGTIVIEDHYGTGAVSHRADVDLGGNDNITVISGTESNGTTTLVFVIPLNSGDDFDTVISPGDTIKIIIAQGKRDNLTSRHNKRGSFEITL